VTISQTPTVTPTVSFTPTETVTPTITVSVTPTNSVTPTMTPTVTPTITPIVSLTPTMTPTETVTPTPTITITPTVTPTNSVTPTVTPTVTTTPYATVTPSVTKTLTPTVTQTVTPTLPIAWDGILVFQSGGPSTISTPDTYVDFSQPGTYVAGISCFYQNAPAQVSFGTLASYTLSTFAFNTGGEQHVINIQITNPNYYGKLFAIKYPANWWTVYGDANQGKPYANGTLLFIRILEGNVSRIIMRDSYFNK
jgi:hypothetical protein